ncbi:hypothetical protein CGGC5_v000674 [Colletotrichum fructicola Nara gc5]|uniref:Uncharacterized protein n=1 Tax=Colletotrichum fructicola (strain Nara gc5) TaxID=1213859 RepID=A0A7J6JSR5_COLFN|nr:hypothetical protein CGGC5_v000674 [Colletotrichum fructicola Nara gc5]
MPSKTGDGNSNTNGGGTALKTCDHAGEVLPFHVCPKLDALIPVEIGRPRHASPHFTPLAGPMKGAEARTEFTTVGTGAIAGYLTIPPST